MKLLTLLAEFLKIGAFSFGGGYVAIPLIMDTVLARGWLDDTQLLNLLGISESTPGPIMVNAATVIGYGQGGIIGAALATLGVILPAFLIMLFVPRIRERLRGNRVLRPAMQGIKPCVAGVICAAGAQLALELFLPAGFGQAVDLRAVLLFAGLAACLPLYRKLFRKQMSPILLIVLAAVLGIALF